MNCFINLLLQVWGLSLIQAGLFKTIYSVCTCHEYSTQFKTISTLSSGVSSPKQLRGFELVFFKYIKRSLTSGVYVWINETSSLLRSILQKLCPSYVTQLWEFFCVMSQRALMPLPDYCQGRALLGCFAFIPFQTWKVQQSIQQALNSGLIC